MTDLDDIHFIKQIEHGDVDAFVHIVRRYEQMIFSIVNKIVINEQDAEDVVQEVFIKVYQSLGKFRHDSQFSTWLFRIAYNTTISHVRKSKMHQTFDDDIFDKLPETEIDDSLEGVRKEELLQYLDNILHELNPADALLITMFYMNNQNIQEISNISGLSTTNVKVKLHRIRKFMNFELNKRIRNEE